VLPAPTVVPAPFATCSSAVLPQAAMLVLTDNKYTAENASS